MFGRVRTRCLVPLLLLAACGGRGKNGARNDAGVPSASAVAPREAPRPPDAAAAEAPLPSSETSTIPEHVRRAQEECAKPNDAEPPIDAAYALLSEGKRDAAVRELLAFIRLAGSAPAGEGAIRDGLPDGVELVPGAKDWSLGFGKDKRYSYLFRGATLVRRIRGRAEFVPATDLLRVVDGAGTTLVRVPTGDVVFRAFSTDAHAVRPGGCAVVHTRCDGGQEIVVFSGASSARTFATTLDPRSGIEPSSFGPNDRAPLGWIDDDHVWMRGVRGSVVYDLSKGLPDPPPEGAPDWGVITPRLDPKRTVAVAHYGTVSPDQELSTTLIDWSARRVLRKGTAGPHGGPRDPGTQFSESGATFVLRDETPKTELVLFDTAGLGARRLTYEGKGIVAYRFWPRADTIFLEEPAGVAILDAAAGTALARFPLAPGRTKVSFVSEGVTSDAAFVIEECINPGPRSRIAQTRVTRDLKSKRTEKPGACQDATATMTAFAKTVCHVDGIDGIFPREVCTALRADAKDRGRKR